MTLIGRLHPLLVHFPIALVVVAALAELAAVVTRAERWRIVAVANLRAAAIFAVATAAAGWRLAASMAETAALLEWHQWLGFGAAGATVAAALATVGSEPDAPGRWIYRIALASALALVTATAHLGGLLVWGADFFFRP